MSKIDEATIKNLEEEGYTIPDFVKEASDSTPTMYAYNNGLKNVFPIDTPANAWLSEVEFLKHASEIPEKDRDIVAQRLQDAHDFHKIEINRTIEKKASASEEFVKLASDISSYEKRVHGLSLRQRRALAKELKKRAESLSEGSEQKFESPIVERYSGDDIAPDWRDHILDRLSISASHPLAKRDYSALLNSPKDVENHENPEELAELVEHLDKKYHLDSHWDMGIRDPYYSMLAHNPRKKAIVIVMRVNDHGYTPEDMERLDRKSLNSQLAPDVIDEIFDNKNKSLDHLPMFVKNIIAKVLNA